jgi:hypothetical protein
VGVLYFEWKSHANIVTGYPEFVKMEAMQGEVHPRLILFGAEDVPGNERAYLHNYIVIRFKHGLDFVLDFTGYQFGFDTVLYTLKEYEQNVLRGPGWDADIAQKGMERRMQSDEEYGLDSLKALELRAFAWRLCHI